MIIWKYAENTSLFTKKSDFHRGKPDFSFIKILRVPAYQGQSDSEYLTSLISQKLDLLELLARPPLLLKYCADSKNLTSPASL